MAILEKAFVVGHKVANFAVKHGPTIAVVGGSVAVIAGSFFACKATLKASDIIEQHNAQMDKIREATERYEESYDDDARKKDKIQVYASTAGKFARLYGPAIGLELAGFAAIFGGFGVLKSRYGIALGTITALDEYIADYRKQVIEEYGIEADERFSKNRGELHEIERTVTDDDGNEKTEKYNAIAVDDITGDPFTFVFQKYVWDIDNDGNKYRRLNRAWEDGSYLFNDNTLMQLQNSYTRLLQSRRLDHLFLNKILNELDLPETRIGHDYGWTSQPGCCVDLRVVPVIKMWDDDDSKQFPMYIPINPNNDEEFEMFRQAYMDDDEQVAYILKPNVDHDEYGIPREIRSKVFAM